jgi:hypothetical protein
MGNREQQSSRERCSIPELGDYYERLRGNKQRDAQYHCCETLVRQQVSRRLREDYNSQVIHNAEIPCLLYLIKRAP